MQGTILGHEQEYALDEGHTLEHGRPVLVCGNTAAMLGEKGVSWLSPHFQVQLSAILWPLSTKKNKLNASCLCGRLQSLCACRLLVIEAHIMGPSTVVHRLPLLASLPQLQLRTLLHARHPLAAVDLSTRPGIVAANANTSKDLQKELY